MLKEVKMLKEVIEYDIRMKEPLHGEEKATFVFFVEKHNREAIRDEMLKCVERHEGHLIVRDDDRVLMIDFAEGSIFSLKIPELTAIFVFVTMEQYEKL